MRRTLGDIALTCVALVAGTLVMLGAVRGLDWLILRLLP
jgi:hypothetical protein